MTDLPPPETTPFATVRLATGTPRFVEASSSSACFAVAAAARSAGPALDWIAAAAGRCRRESACQLRVLVAVRSSGSTSMSSSSAAIIRRPVGDALTELDLRPS